MKKAPFLIFIICLALAAFIAWNWYPLRSLSVMSVYSALHAKNSITADNGFKIRIPGGFSTSERDWYPFVMTFNAENYRIRGGAIEGMTVLYNFPAFNLSTRKNMFYEPGSPYNSSFYGAYAIESSDSMPFGFTEDGEINHDEVMHAFRYDYVNLVLDDLGEKDFDFTVKTSSSSKSNYLGYPEWDKVIAEIQTNSVSHTKSGFKRNYIQYGPPMDNNMEQFPGITMYGILYMRYFPEYDCTVIMYAMSQDMETLKDCDEKILSKSEILEIKEKF